jgi:hypothetical protein
MDVRQRARAPPVPPLGAQHDEIQRVHGLHLLPRLAPTARGVRCVERLDHDAFVPGRQRLLEERGRLVVGRAKHAGHPVRTDGPVQRIQPRRQRLVDQVGTVEVQAVEEEGAEQQFMGVGPEPARRLLERARPAVVLQRESLAVEHHAPARQAAHELHQLGHAVGHFAQRARPYADHVLVAVHLDARAVHLVLDADPGPELGERGVQALGRARQHGPDRAADLGRHRFHRSGAAGEGEPRRFGEAAREEERPAHRGRRDLGGGGHGLQHHAVERALPQLAGEQPL